ncbi:hypothetical protein ANTPLA_LOCUS7915 [Anthophora plagiata]
MLSQVLTRHCDIVSAHRSVRNQLSRATAARPVTHIHHRTSLFTACIIRNRGADCEKPVIIWLPGCTRCVFRACMYVPMLLSSLMPRRCYCHYTVGVTYRQ